ncbi:putative minor extracellular protease vpr protein [Rosellinia necatrix]|uniref:Putative minor extracellular protease vpr protein n=1 Tax=Rosellinia necatrix TaxID=77044 RepID=A0A1W2TRG5_ROSNE|nr:putative minor extracellular protease vpr protein [Rosellinia necatrix]
MVRSGFVLSLLASAGGFLSADARKHPEAKHLTGSYVVEFEDSQDASEFFSRVGSKAETRMSFDSSIFKGVSIQFHDTESAADQAAALEGLASVKRVWPNRIYELPKDEVIWTGKSKDASIANSNIKRQLGNDTFSPHLMTQVDKLRAKGIVGKGIKIAVIDTGIDYTHPALGGCFGPGCLVSYGTDIVGDDYDGFNTPVPDDDPYDGCAGHGSHVSGIIAAQANEYGFTGAAPGVTLGAYRVFGCTGSAANDVLIEAYIQAFEAGSNIITASIGGPSGWSEDPWAVVVSRIVAAGVPCTVSAGNAGAMGLFYASTASNGKRVTSIASIDNWVTPVLLIDSSFSVDGGETETFGYVPGDPSAWAGVNLPIWTPNFNTADPAQGCTAFPADTPDLSGYIVLIRRGTCTFVQKATNAANAGAKYVLFYNNVPTGASGPAVNEVTAIKAVGMTPSAQGEAWVKALAAGSKVVLDMADPETAAVSLITADNTLTGGSASTFTTWNPTFEMDVKPQVASPGGNILSTYPQTLGSYAVISGTSMACPLVAGIYALIADVRGTFDPATLENLIASTANPRLYNAGGGASGIFAPVAQVGAGLVQAYDAAYATTLLSRSSLAFNDTDHLQKTLTFTIKNLGKDRVTYKLGSVGAATAYTFSDSIYPDLFPGLEVTDEYAKIKLSHSSITVPARGSAVVSVTVTPPKLDGARLPVYSGYITLNGTNGENLSLPYNGAVGSLYGTQVLDTGYLAISTDPDLNPVSGSAAFVLSKTPGAAATLPVAVALMAFGSPRISIKLLQVKGKNTKNLGDIFASPYDYASRDAYPATFDGRLADGSYVPAGEYKFSIEALHIFGNAKRSKDWDVAVSAPFTIRYS